MSAATSLANGDSGEYWRAAEAGRLVFQKCAACGVVQFPPRHHCAACWQADLHWIESSGQGRVETYTVVHRAPLPDFRGRVPYVVATVTVAEGPRMIATLVGDSALEVRIGDAVTVDFEKDAAGRTLPVFRRD